MEYYKAENYKWIKGEGYKKKVILDRIKEKIDLVQDVIVEPSGDIPLHKHQFTDEIFYVLEGKGKLKLEDREVDVFSGDLVKIYKGELHAFKNETGPPLRMFCFKINFREGDSFLD